MQYRLAVRPSIPEATEVSYLWFGKAGHQNPTEHTCAGFLSNRKLLSIHSISLNQDWSQKATHSSTPKGHAHIKRPFPTQFIIDVLVYNPKSTHAILTTTFVTAGD